MIKAKKLGLVGRCLLAGAIFLGGCSEKPKQETLNLKDLNNDGRPEQVYFEEDGKGIVNFGYITRNLLVREGKEKGFGEPKILHTFKGWPKEIQIKDINGNGNQDLVYLIKGKNPKDYDLIVRYGNGDGTFQKEKLIEEGYKEVSL